jgi:hypothetical protein
VLDLLDITAIDVPELRRTAIEVPILIGKRNDLGHGAVR